MSPLQISVALFMLGGLLQLFIMMLKKPSKKAMLSAMAVFAIGVYMNIQVYTETSNHLTGDKYIWGFAIGLLILTSFIIGGFFYKSILKTVSEATIFSLTISFWVAALTDLRTVIFDVGPAFTTIIIFGTFLTIYAVATSKPLPDWMKPLIYIWHILVVFILAGLIAVKVGFSEGKVLFDFLSVNGREYLGSFLSGIAVAISIGHLGLLFAFFNEGSDEAWKHLDKNIDKVFKNHQLHKMGAFWLVLSQAVYLSVFLFLTPYFGLEVLLIWVLLTPMASSLITKLIPQRKKAARQ